MPSPRVKELSESLILDTGLLTSQDRDNLSLALRLAAQESDQAEPHMTTEDQAFFHGFVQEVFDYVRHMNASNLAIGAETWQDLFQESMNWHLEGAQSATQQDPGLTWPSLVSLLQQGDLSAVALTSQYDLAQEGQQMQHCVAMYGRRCHQGRSRIFSIRRDDKPVATGEIIPRDEAWSVNQVAGPANTRAIPEASQLMQQVADQYTKLQNPSS